MPKAALTLHVVPLSAFKRTMLIRSAPCSEVARINAKAIKNIVLSLQEHIHKLSTKGE